MNGGGAQRSFVTPIANVWSLQCPSGSRPFPPTSCVKFGEQPDSYDGAQARCALDGGALLTVVDSVQLTAALRYVETLGQRGSTYWINVTINSTGLAPGGHQCTAIRNVTLFKMENCTQPQSRLCQTSYTGDFWKVIEFNLYIDHFLTFSHAHRVHKCHAHFPFSGLTC